MLSIMVYLILNTSFRPHYQIYNISVASSCDAFIFSITFHILGLSKFTVFSAPLPQMIVCRHETAYGESVDSTQRAPPYGPLTVTMVYPGNPRGTRETREFFYCCSGNAYQGRNCTLHLAYRFSNSYRDWNYWKYPLHPDPVAKKDEETYVSVLLHRLSSD